MSETRTSGHKTQFKIIVTRLKDLLVPIKMKTKVSIRPTSYINAYKFLQSIEIINNNIMHIDKLVHAHILSLDGVFYEQCIN